MPKQVLKFLTALFLFSFPLERLGVIVGGYPITIPFIAISLISLTLVINAKFNKRQIFIACSLILWIIGSLIATGKFSGLLSAFVFAIMVIPSLSILPANLDNTAFKWLIRGSILSLIFASYDTFTSFTGAPTFREISPLFLEQNIDQILTFRFKSTFLEPSVYAIYLAFMIIILDYLPANYFSIWKRRLLFAAYTAALIVTLSISGWVLVATYYIAKLLLQSYSVVFHKMHVNPKSIVISLSGFVLVCILAVSVSNALQLDIAEYINKRIFRAAQLTTRGSLEHEGTRTNAFRVVGDYYAQTSIEGILIGEGFNSYEKWLITNYSRELKSTMIEGKISNIYAAVALGSGIIGLILYVLFIISYMPFKFKHVFNPNTRYILCYMIVWIMAQFATGSLILYYIWGYIFIFVIIVNSNKLNLPGVKQSSPGRTPKKQKLSSAVRSSIS